MERFRCPGLTILRKKGEPTLIPSYLLMIMVRRLLYVACTRAQGLLYLIHAQRRNVAGRTINVDRSPFVEKVFQKYPVRLMMFIDLNV